MYTNALKTVVTACTGLKDEPKEAVFARLESATHKELLDNIFSPVHLMCSIGYCSSGFAQCGLPMSMVILSGELMVVGCHTSYLQGYSYKAKEDSMRTMDQTTFESLLDRGTAFYSRMSAGSFLYIPVGYHTMQMPLANTHLIKWSVMSNSDKPSLMLSACTQMVASNPSLATGLLQSFMGILQGLKE